MIKATYFNATWGIEEIKQWYIKNDIQYKNKFKGELIMEEKNLTEPTWTRLYGEDLAELEKLSKRIFRKKSQIIRMLVHEGLKRKLIEEVKDSIPENGPFCPFADNTYHYCPAMENNGND